MKQSDVYIKCAVYNPFLDGFSAVFSDGRAAKIVLSPDDSDLLDSEGNNISSSAWRAKGIWAPNLTQATCTAFNNKYRLLSFGTLRYDLGPLP